MPHGIEYIVRPFASPNSLGNRVIPASPKRTQETAHLTWGGVGRMPEVKTINPDSKVNVCHETANERNRDSSRQRIYGNDGESYVDVERAEKIRLNKTERTDAAPLSTSWQGFPITPNLDPKLDPYLNNFKQKQPVEAERRCDLVWGFKNALTQSG